MHCGAMFKRNSCCSRVLSRQNGQSLFDRQRLIADAQAGIERQTGQPDPFDNHVVIIGHPRPLTGALTEVNRQPHDRRGLVAHFHEAGHPALYDSGHSRGPRCDQPTPRFADVDAVVADQGAKRAFAARARHQRQRQRAFARTRRSKDQDAALAMDHSRRMEDLQRSCRERRQFDDKACARAVPYQFVGIVVLRPADANVGGRRRPVAGPDPAAMGLNDLA